MEELIKQYIKDELNKLEYVGDTVKLKNVYPSIIEEIVGSFNKPFDLNGNHCDYWVNIGIYDIYGCMSNGTADITLVEGRNRNYERSDTICVQVGHEIKSKLSMIEKINIYMSPPEGSKGWKTFYFSFGKGHICGAYVQPIKSENWHKAHQRMRITHGDTWLLSYSQYEWNSNPYRYKCVELELIYG